MRILTKKFGTTQLPTLDEINSWEIKVDITLPKYYIDFLLLNGGGQFEESDFYFKETDCLYGISSFEHFEREYWVNKIIEITKNIGKIQYLPFGYCASGSYFHIDLESEKGAVYYIGREWDEEKEEYILVKVTDTFEAFINGLENIEKIIFPSNSRYSR